MAFVPEQAYRWRDVTLGNDEAEPGDDERGVADEGVG